MRKTENAHFGQKIVTESAPDRSSHGKVTGMDKKMAGGPTDVSHSLSGAGDVVTDNDTGRKPRK